MEADVILRKLANAERCLARIRQVTGGDPDTLDDLDIEEIVTLNLQRAIQSSIDLAAHLISRNNWGLPDTLRGHFSILSRQGVIPALLLPNLQAMVGFRNIAVHEYETLDVRILKAIVRDHLEDLDAYLDHVRRFVASAG